MPLGILEDRHLAHVPGTALLEALSIGARPTGISAAVCESPNLKRGTGVNAHIVLVPQPSDDPRDPLNWPILKREALFWSVCFTAGLASALTTILAPGFYLLGEQWNVSVNSIASAAGYITLGGGCIMILQSGIAVKYGRRPVFLVSAVVLFTCSMWTAVSQGLTSFLVSRVFQGFGTAAFLSLVTTTIGDIYFVHQRGLRVAIWNFSVTGGVNIAPIINGHIIQSPALGWRWTYWIITILLGIALILIVLFVPETSYVREPQIADNAVIDSSNISIKSGVSGHDFLSHVDSLEKGYTGSGDEKSATSRTGYLPPKTFLEELKPWSGHINHTPLLKLVIRPIYFFLSPAVWFAIFSHGLTLSWLLVLAVISSVVFAQPPINFTAAETGLISIGPLVSGIISTVISGPLCDYSAIWFARRNKGVYEPESRLFLLLPMLVLEVAGYGFWALMHARGVQWIGPVMMYSIIYLGSGIGSTGIVTYVIDVHQGNAPECFALISLFTFTVAFGFTQFAVKWVETMGIPLTFGILAGFTAVCILTAVPMYVFGKRARSWVHRHPKLFLIDQN